MSTSSEETRAVALGMVRDLEADQQITSLMAEIARRIILAEEPESADDLARRRRITRQSAVRQIWRTRLRLRDLGVPVPRPYAIRLPFSGEVIESKGRRRANLHLESDLVDLCQAVAAHENSSLSAVVNDVIRGAAADLRAVLEGEGGEAE